MYPHCDGGCDFAWPRSNNHGIRSSVLWEVFSEVHRRFVNHTRVFGHDNRLELLGRQIKTEEQRRCLLAVHDGCVAEGVQILWERVIWRCGDECCGDASHPFEPVLIWPTRRWVSHPSYRFAPHECRAASEE